jgi:hypothetical protein
VRGCVRLDSIVADLLAAWPNADGSFTARLSVYRHGSVKAGFTLYAQITANQPDLSSVVSLASSRWQRAILGSALSLMIVRNEMDCTWMRHGVADDRWQLQR